MSAPEGSDTSELERSAAAREATSATQREPTAANEAWVRSVLRLMLVVTVMMVAARIAVVESRGGLVPCLSANDRSRWCTVAALVEDGTYQIDRQLQITAFDPQRKRDVRPWQSIDRVRHQGRDGIYHDYSSKPPLLPTCIAGIYWMVYQATQLPLTEHPMYVGRIVLAMTNLPLLLLFLLPTLSLIRRHGRSDWGRLLTTAAACFGTLLLPFAVSLNNHLPAAAGGALALWILTDRERSGRWGWQALAGLAAGWMAANELPALSMLGLLGLIALWRRPLAACWGFIPGALVVAVAFFGTNWIAHESLRPPYAHRGNGPEVTRVTIENPQTEFPDIGPVRAALIEAGEEIDERMAILGSTDEGRWMAITESGNDRYAVLRRGSTWQICRWDDWYEYEGSYWTGGRRQGVDRGEPSRWVYLFHTTLGHHGLFSLTPIWLLSVIGVVGWWRRHEGWDRMVMVAVIVIATLVCFAFYIARPLIDRNYGGVSAALRWMLWFSPFWLWLMLPAADGLSHRRAGRIVGLGLLAVSVFSMMTVIENPWQSPWLYRFWDYLGWMNPG